MPDLLTSEIGLQGLAAGATGIITLSLSASYAFFTVRAGTMISSFLATMPAWTLVDPFPVLTYIDDKEKRKKRGEREDEETLESMVQRREHGERRASAP